MIYYYNVGVYDYEGHTQIYFTNTEEFSHHEFVLIVQECIDIVIEKYSKESEYCDNNPCLLDTYDIIQLPKFRVEMRKKGFEPLKFTASCNLEEKKIFDDSFGKVFIKGRYTNLSLGKCKECFKDEDEVCPVQNKRR